METAAIYTRVSTEDQEKEGSSLDSQLEACITKAKELDCEVPEDYAFREVWTGADTDRPGLNELRQIIKRRLVDCVICHSTDRLARNPIHIAIVAEECEKRDISLVFVTEPLDNSMEGQLIRYVKGFSAQVEREKIKERTMRGKKQKAREGKLSTGGTCLFGYDMVDGKRVINLINAGTVKRIFNWLAFAGYTTYRVVNDLNNAGIGAPRGGRWTEQAILRILNNPAYKGVTYAFRYKVVEPKRPKKEQRPYSKTTHQFRDKAEWIEIPGATPAIVSPEVYDAAQEQLSLNRGKTVLARQHEYLFTNGRQMTTHNRKHEYLFINGRLRCGKCGRSMVGSCKKKSNGDKLRYRCICNVKTNYYDHCEQPSIAATRIEPAVWEEITRVLNNPELILAELENQHKDNIPVTIEAEEILTEGNIKKSHEEETRYLRRYGQGLIDDSKLDYEISRVKRYREAEELKLAKLKDRRKALEDAHLRLDKISDVLAVFAERLSNADYELKQLAMDALDIKATVQPSGEVQLTGTIPTEVQLTKANTPTSRVCMGELHPGIPFALSLSR